jgi:uncharacterized protein YjbI with pentapeptide repeats
LRQFEIVAAGLLFAFFGLCNHLSAKMQKAEVAFLSADGTHSSTAVSGQTVVFESDSADNWVHVSLSEGQHQLCLENSGEYFTGIVLDDTIDQQEPDAHGCLTVTGRRRFHRVRLSHGPDKPTEREIALLSIDRPGVPLVSANGEMRKGYWAVTQWSQTGRTESIAGRLRAIPSSEGRMPIVADRTSKQIDSYSLWNFRVHSGVMLADAKSAFSFDPNGFPDSVKGTVFVTHGGEGPSLRASGDSNRFQLRIAENNDISPGTQLGFAPTLFAPQTLKVLRSPSFGRPAMFTLLFRFFPDAIDVDSLAEGEAVLYQSADYQGRATVFPASAPDLAALSSDATTLERGAVSIRVGPGTEATLYTGANYSGIATHIYNDVPVFAGAGNVASVRLTSLVARLLVTRSCVECNFEGVDLSGLDLSDTDLTGAKLAGTNLTNTRLNGAQLTRADLSRATLSCTDLSGANANQLDDLTRTTFSNVKIVPRNSCQTNFSYTRLLVDALPPRSLAILKLTGVHYERPPQAQAPVPGPPLVDANGNPVGGYWAIQPDPALDPQKRAGRLRATPPFQPIFGQNANDAWVQADYTSQKMDEYSLFAFPPNPNTNGSILSPGTFFNAYNYGDNEDTAVFLTVGQGYTCGDFCTEVNQRLKLIDLGNYRFQLGYYSFWAASGPFYVWSGGPGPANSLLNLNDVPLHPPPTTFRVMFRFFPDGTQIGPLADGEAALFQEPGFKGKAAVFAADPNGYNLDLLEGGATTLPGTVQSVRLGNNTAIAWTTPSRGLWAPGLLHDADDVNDDYGALEHVIYVQKLDRAIEIYAPFAQNGAGPDPPFFLAPSCSGCRMANGNISGVSLQGWNFSGAIFSGATLSNVKLDSTTQLANAKFNNATLSTVQFGNLNLQSVDLSGATLTNSVLSAAKIDNTTNLTGSKMSCVDFSGSDSSHLVDLTQINLSAVQWIPDPSCRTNFSYTKLSVTQIPPSIWKNFNLTGAVFVDLNPHLSSQEQPLDLTGAMLGHMSLKGVFLDYAVMKNIDLTQTVLSDASLQHVDLTGAKLYGAQLDNANLDNANLSDAYLTPSQDGTVTNLQGAFLRNVNLFQGHFSSANFKNASFYSSLEVGVCSPDGFTRLCATASHANMFATNFEGAYLFGVDFTGAQITGVNFENSFLAGANFTGATLLADTSRPETSFSGAFLQGTNLNELMIQSGFSLKNAFVDFAPSGNTLTLKLGGEHTHFSGYWDTPGQSVCAQMVYNQPTTIPQTDQTVTCPDGSQNQTGCGPANPDGSNLHWKSPDDISSFASYKDNATYTPASGRPICQFDPKWIFPDSSLSGQNPASRHRPGRGKRP